MSLLPSPRPSHEVPPQDSRPESGPLKQRLSALDFPRSLVFGTISVLIVGWAVIWPNLNRDFNHLHGWDFATHAQLARTSAEVGLPRLGFEPALYPLNDTGGNYFYITRYPPLGHYLLWPIMRIAPARYEQATLRLFGLALTGAFLAFLYMTGRRLGGRRVGAWTLFFGGVSAEVFFFGVFPAMYVVSTVFVAAAYCSYLAWRSRADSGWPVLTLLCLAGAYLSWWSAYVAAFPLLVDLVRHNTRVPWRNRRQIIFALLVLPVIVYGAMQFQRNFVVQWLTHHDIWASTGSLREDFAQRGQYDLLVSPSYYAWLARSLITFLSPVGLIAVCLFLIWKVLERTGAATRPQQRTGWQLAFVGSSFVLGAFPLAFPKHTLDHQFSFFQLAIPFALAAALFVVNRGLVVRIAAVVLTIALAFSTATYFKAVNNTPAHEFELGVAIRLATPTGAFVRVPLPADGFFPMLAYSADRNLIFSMPPRFEPAAVTNRFDVVYYPQSVADSDAAIFVPSAHAVLLDHDAAARPPLPRVERSYEGGAFTITGAGVTEASGDWQLVELTWASRRSTKEALSIEIGEAVGDSWTTLLTANLRGDTVDTSRSRPGTGFRDGFLVHGGPKARLVLRVFDRASWHYRASTDGRTDLPLEQIPAA